MDILFGPLFDILQSLLGMYHLVLILYVIMSWLELFNLVNRYNPTVYRINSVLFQLTEPLLTPIRRFIPQGIGIDLSPLVLFFLIFFLDGVLTKIRFKLGF